MAQNVIPHNETTSATTPVNGCMYFDQGSSGGTDTKLCASSASTWATAYGFGPLTTSASISAALDTIGSTQGGVLYRGASAWAYLGPGTSGQFLETLGTGANPQWAAAGGGGGTPGGANTNVQFNNSGSFGGSTGIDLNTTKVLSMSIGLGSDATGDIYYNGGSGTLTRLGIGTTGQFLGVSGGIPAWGSPSGSGTVSSCSTADALAYYAATGTTVSCLAGVGTSGQILTSNGTGAAPTFQNNAGATFANPTATAGPSAINGSATTAMRSDAAPAVQLGTNAQKGIIEGDGQTVTCSSSGVCATTSPDRTVTTSTTIAATDMGGLVVYNGSSLTATIPAISSTVLAAGMSVQINNMAATPVTISTTPTINNYPSVGGTMYIPGGGGIFLLSNGTSLDAIALGSAAVKYSEVTYGPGQNLSTNALPMHLTGSIGVVINEISGAVEVAEGGTATCDVWMAASGTALGSGTKLTSTSFNANGTAATNQTGLLGSTVIVPAGNRFGLVCTGFGTTSGSGTIKVSYQG